MEPLTLPIPWASAGAALTGRTVTWPLGDGRRAEFKMHSFVTGSEFGDPPVIAYLPLPRDRDDLARFLRGVAEAEGVEL